jgi:hypothetical protein
MERDSIFGNGAVAALVLVIAMAFYWTKNSWGPADGTVKMPESESYEMGRPDSFATNEYDISGRKLVRTVNDPNQNLAKQVLGAPNAVPAVAVSNAVAGAQPAKSASQAAADAKKLADAQKKKAQVAINVVDSNREKMRGFADTQNTKQTPNPYVYAQVRPPVAPPTSPGDNPEKDKLTAAQWRAILFADPSSNNVKNFVAAFQGGEISGNEFYQIADNLLADAAEDRQDAGLRAYASDYSVRSFTVLAKIYQASSSSEEQKTKIYSSLRAYGEPSRLSLLSRIFYLNDAPALTLAAQVLGQTLAAQTPSTNVQDGRQGRGPVSLAIPVSRFQAFLTPLNRLLSNQEAGLASQAQALIDQIKSLSNA